eukprot:m.28768 g.28768  ORF g.28768 m.28768 type:complete len:104 (-) comp11923_c0_seq1:35-346(-)
MMMMMMLMRMLMLMLIMFMMAVMPPVTTRMAAQNISNVSITISITTNAIPGPQSQRHKMTLLTVGRGMMLWNLQLAHPHLPQVTGSEGLPPHLQHRLHPQPQQ